MQNLQHFLPRISLKLVLILLVILYLLLLTVPYLAHKRVSDTYMADFQKRSFYAQSDGKQAGPERVAYINDNTQALLYRLSLLEKAEKEIILSTFDFNTDTSGSYILASLFQAAERGVQVRLIIDGGNGFLDVQGSPVFKALSCHENVQIKLYNPINLLRPWKLQARLHDKYLIVDRKMYLLGGRNTTDLFLGDFSDGQNIDRELFVLSQGEAADSSLAQLLSYFEQIWALPDSKAFRCRKAPEDLEKIQADWLETYQSLRSLYPDAFVPWDWYGLTLETGRVQLLHNPVHAANKEPWMWHSLKELMSQGRQVTIYTPYIICGPEMYKDLKGLTESGIDIQIITNDVASGANPWGCTDYMNQKKKIFNTGLQVYEYMGPHSCHTKAVVIDDRLSLVGSYNLDMRSTYQDTELMLAVDCPELNALIRKEAEEDKSFSRVMDKDGNYSYGPNYVPREQSFLKQLFYGVLRIIIIPIRRFL